MQLGQWVPEVIINSALPQCDGAEPHPLTRTEPAVHWENGAPGLACTHRTHLPWDWAPPTSGPGRWVGGWMWGQARSCLREAGGEGALHPEVLSVPALAVGGT